VYGFVFRHEPSLDPARMQSFRQYEYVFVGEPEGAEAHRDLWLQRGSELLEGLGLDVHAEVANDPFFGRLGRLLAANQQEEELKYEILAPTSPASRLTAITSANCHRDHFGAAFALRTASREVAHSACVGFGVERITLALLWEHGLDPSSWPEKVREQLWL
jgi:seryl-tRNA synthetase